MVEINQKLSARPVDQEGLFEFINRELVPVVEKLRLATVELGESEFVTLSASDDLDNERVLTAGTNITLTLASGTVTISATNPLKPEREVTASRDNLADDPDYTLVFNSASAITYTVNASVVPVGTIQYLCTSGAGQLTIASGTTLVTSAETLKLRRTGSGGQIHYLTSATAKLFGDLELT